MNQHNLSGNKEEDILYYWIICFKTQRQVAKILRLNPKTVKRIIKEKGYSNYKNLKNPYYINLLKSKE